MATESGSRAGAYPDATQRRPATSGARMSAVAYLGVDLVNIKRLLVQHLAADHTTLRRTRPGASALPQRIP